MPLRFDLTPMGVSTSLDTNGKKGSAPALRNHSPLAPTVGLIYNLPYARHRKSRIRATGTAFALTLMMLKKIGRLFIIKTRLEACLIIYALAVGAMARGSAYIHEYPGVGGKLLLLACTGSVFLAGAKIFDCLRYEQAAAAVAEDRA